MQRGNTLSSVNDKPTLSVQSSGGRRLPLIVIHEETTREVTIVSIVIVGESETFTPLVGQNFPSLPSFAPRRLFLHSRHGYTCAHRYIHTYVHTCVRANVPRVAFAMQNSPARRSLIMHSARRRCATIESPGRALRRARSSARVDFPRYIFATDDPRRRVPRGLAFAARNLNNDSSPVSFRDGLREMLNCGIVVAIFSSSLSLFVITRMHKVFVPDRYIELRAFLQSYNMQMYRSEYFRVIEVVRLVVSPT